ncbi:MAG: hypothetical protein ACI8W3_002579 [Myxococcota bacterium]|jgi:hypothetical protein
MHFRLRNIAIISAVLLLAASEVIAAQILTNGDFELVDGRIGEVRSQALDNLSNGRWDVYDTLPGGWYTSNGAGIEVEYSGTVVNAYSGNHYIELDSHPGPDSNSSMSIDLVLNEGDHFLSFMYFPRTTQLGDNGISVLMDGVEVLTADGFRDNNTTWQQYEFNFLGMTAGLHTLTFEAFGIENTLGGFIDDIKLDGPGNPVPEPSAALVYGLGMLVLAGTRRGTRG